MSATTTHSSTTTVLTGLHFAESPSIGPDGHLYISDFYAHQLLRVDASTWTSTVAADVPGQPSGMGWLPDGTMLVVSMRDTLLLAVEPDGRTRVYADLSSIARGAANDMLVDSDGRAWVGSFGFDFYSELAADPDADPLFGPNADPPTADLARVDPDGSVHLAATGLRFPNGTVQLSDGTLVIAETVGACLTAFTITADGILANQRTLVDMSTLGVDGPILPDGICIDTSDGIWVSDPVNSRVVRIDVSTETVTDIVTTAQPCFAVGLIGEERRTLLCCTAASSNPNIAGTKRTGALEIADVQVGGAH
ncbi:MULTISPECIES: SMP-30/gluconolactonase/LRE family protein [unclassified Rhodococcus (in: high G+C Gram-positive bacteria)]|uniref:SMP-30/gluconolactonase/LRE family protein n=1 Tax=unclassified Rhodococcus (in: high G+C Gram-positive bacteria) TaxID=192944 RepID=UPI00117BAD28|nr:MULTISPECIES: SMP-30/gluconolactonase/LRE family protein [unclassified Rhodococcus (in: high G+C Gram-positive bacteria)]